MSKIVDEIELSVEMRECRIKINKASQRYCPFEVFPIKEFLSRETAGVETILYGETEIRDGESRCFFHPFCLQKIDTSYKIKP